jgi:hypothetical protein
MDKVDLFRKAMNVFVRVKRVNGLPTWVTP